MSEFAPEYLAKLTDELLRVVTYNSRFGKFTTDEGEAIEGATESDVIKHLTSGHDYVTGRQFRFPGLSNGWHFESAIKAAGFRRLRARNYRNQICTVITL